MQENERSQVDSFERSFETQSGFLVLVKPIGNRLSLSFKRQIGTPPISSIFLTPDEATRLANILGPDADLDTESIDYSRIEAEASYINLLRPVRSKRSRVVETMILLMGTLILCAVMVIIAYQLHHSH